MESGIEKNVPPSVNGAGGYAGRAPVVPHAEWQKHIECPHYLKPAERMFAKLSLEASATHEENLLQTSLLIFMLEGQAEIRTRGETAAIGPRQMVYVEPGGRFSIEASPACSCILFRFEHFTYCEQLTFRQLVDDERPAPDQVPVFAVSDLLDGYLRQLSVYMESNLWCMHMQQLKHEECFILLRVCYSREQLQRLFAPMLSEDIQFRLQIMKLSTEVRTASELAERCNVSEQTLLRKIRKLFGCSPYQWLLQRRNENILLDIRSGKSVKELCYTYKFTAPGNFTNYCKKQFGLSASQIAAFSVEEYNRYKQQFVRQVADV